MTHRSVPEHLNQRALGRAGPCGRRAGDGRSAAHLFRRFDIGTASSLPWNVGPDWKGMLDTYDRSHLTTDTLALLTETTPIVVRMETLRRAALYATTDKRAAQRAWSPR